MKKKTLGILTFNRALNYGAVLQALALKNVCEGLGYEVHIVNYLKDTPECQPDLIKEFQKAPNKKRAAVKLARSILRYSGDSRRRHAFVEFRRNYLSESVMCMNPEQVASLGYDAYISGSDQIWNYRITGGAFDPVYFGEISEKAKCVVYAASAQDTPFPLDKEQEFVQMLKNATAPISIREKKLADYAAKTTGIRYPVVLDPTLLAGREFLDQIPQGKETTEKYILIYQIDVNPASDVSVAALEKRFGCKVYTMMVPYPGRTHGRRGDCGPETFLSLLRNAEFLVTNSFHGIALSLLLEKDFYVYNNGGVMTRIDNLLSSVALPDRKITCVADIDPHKKIDYLPVRKHLAEQREASMDYLRDALQGISASTEEERQPFKMLPMEQRKKKDCSGCSACAAVCPVHAISMQPDEEGFLYPVIDSEACIHCGKCDKVCGFAPKSHWEEGYALPKAYGIKHKDGEERKTSRSGAAFVAFSDYVLDQGGVVYGAAFRDDFSVCHMRAVTKAQRNRMKGAKYVQSEIAETYSQAASDLMDGKLVLFSGTPCQISGLTVMLDAMKISRDNLICCDLVCHGTPSPAIWKAYVSHIEDKYAEQIQTANFRDKEFGWDTHCESFVLKNGKKIVSRDYTDLFYEHIMMRPACHNCHFANVDRVADLTLADFWGIEKTDASFNDNKGVSLVLVSSRKGAQLLDIVKDQLDWIPCEIQNCLQPTLVKPTMASCRRGSFWKDYRQMAFPSFLKKYTKPPAPVPRIKKTLKKVLYRLRIRKHP